MTICRISHRCRACAAVTPHRHMHDCAHGISQTHLHGTERFECTVCYLATFAWSEGADAFRFVLDGPERQAVSSHAGARH